MLRRIFGPNRGQLTGKWRQFHNKEVRGLISLLYIFKRNKSKGMRWTRHVRHVVEVISACQNCNGKIPLANPRRR